MKKKIQHKAGYTLIELMLSVAFLSSLAVVIALVVANSTAVYRRGLTLKNVNMVASEIIDDFSSSEGACFNQCAVDMFSPCGKRHTDDKPGQPHVIDA